MASINKIELKNLKVVIDESGMSTRRGEVWYDGTYLGIWTQSWGDDSYEFDTSVLNEEVAKYVKSSMVEEQYKNSADLDCLLSDLINIMETEKAYKRCVKAGYKNLVVAGDGFHISTLCTNDEESDIKKSFYYKEFVKECKNGFFKDWKAESIKIYKSMDDFKIAV